MHIEVWHYLHHCLAESLRRPAGDFPEGFSRLVEKYLENPKTRVYNCPQQQLGELSCDLAFEMSKLSRKELAQEPQPSYVARVLSDLLAERPENWIITSAVDSGHLNFFLTPTFAIDFSRALLGAEEGELLAFGSLLLGEQSEFEIGFAEGLEHSLECRELLVRAKRESPEEMMEFSKSRDLSKAVLSERDFSVLLALLADPDFEVESYLMGLASRMNVPWYFERFAKDCGEFLSKFEVCDMTSGLASGEDLAALETLRGVFSFRDCFCQSLLSKKPERLLGHLLACIRQFYEQYNSPRARALTSERPLRPADLNFLLFVELLRRFFRASLRSLRLSGLTSGIAAT